MISEISNIATNLATHWRNPTNRRKWFSEFAEESHFDPLVASNWYKITLKQIQSKKVTL